MEHDPKGKLICSLCKHRGKMHIRHKSKCTIKGCECNGEGTPLHKDPETGQWR